MSQPKTPIMATIVIKCFSDELSRLESLEGSAYLKHAIEACEAWWQKNKALLPANLHYLTQRNIEIFNQRLQALVGRIPWLMDIFELPKPLVVYQVPSQEDLRALKGAVAGNIEDQSTRLASMKNVLSTDATSVIDTTEYCNSWVNHLPWQLVFEAIRANELKAALEFFNKIPADDALLKAILTCHSREYLVQLITQCAKLKAHETADCGPDLVCQSRTFEVLIKDLMTTIGMDAACLHVNFGLPSHHARFETGAGFCFMNKLAILCAFEAQHAGYPLKIIAAGLDINQDDGLAPGLFRLPNNTFHIDVYDSGVYPYSSMDDIDEDLEVKAKSINPGHCTWDKEGHQYTTLDLRVLKRGEQSIHPAIYEVLNALNKNLLEAQQSNSMVVLCLPIGWDSHQNETAACGKCIDNKHWLTPEESYQHRFTDKDFVVFYQGLGEIISRYHKNLHRVFWQLEGGYEPSVYIQQIKNMSLIFSDLDVDFRNQYAPKPTGP